MINSLKIWKTSKSVFWYPSARPPKVRGPGHFPGLPSG